MSMFVLCSYTQEADETKPVYHFNGNVSVTNNGFSLIPSFSLGKPATIATLSVGGERFSLDPQFRFDLEGLKPWSPQIYYLTMDGTDGYFAAQSLELGHRKVPVSISSMMNFKLKSDIQVDDFDWNIGLVYTFGSQFTKK